MSYDETIKQHYTEVAEAEGLSATSTMADERTRQIETEAICQTVAWAIRRAEDEGRKLPLNILDVGCGNGYTLGVLRERFRGVCLTGLEYTEKLRELAETRFKNEPVSILPGDIRNIETIEAGSVDVLICQRVIINLLDPADQKTALNSLVRWMRRAQYGMSGAVGIFIEAFQTPLNRLNEARAELGVSFLPPAHHNLYLPDDFFSAAPLKPLSGPGLPEANALSTHYFASRVLHPALLGDRPFVRNSPVVGMLSQALAQNVGDFSPLRVNVMGRL